MTIFVTSRLVLPCRDRTGTQFSANVSFAHDDTSGRWIWEASFPHNGTPIPLILGSSVKRANIELDICAKIATLTLAVPGSVGRTDGSTRRRVLIIEPDLQVAEILADLLTRHNFHVIEVGRLAEAREVLDTHAIDVVVCHPTVPDSPGAADVVQMLSHHPEKAILVISARPAVDIPNLTDAMTHLQKPFGVPEFLSALDTALARADRGPAGQSTQTA